MQLLNAMCEPYLYTHVITDSLPQFPYGVNTPSRARQFSHIRTLKIEFGEKGRQPTYTSLLGASVNLWNCYAADETVRANTSLVECADENEELGDSLMWARDAALVKRLFPRLTSVAVSSIFGGDDALWAKYRDYEERVDSTNDKLRRTNSLFHEFFTGAGVKHFCSREATDPLSNYCFWREDVTFTRALHFNQDTSTFPLQGGSPLSWVSDTASVLEWQTLRDSVQYGAAVAMQL